MAQKWTVVLEVECGNSCEPVVFKKCLTPLVFFLQDSYRQLNVKNKIKLVSAKKKGKDNPLTPLWKLNPRCPAHKYKKMLCGKKCKSGK